MENIKLRRFSYINEENKKVECETHNLYINDNQAVPSLFNANNDFSPKYFREIISLFNFEGLKNMSTPNNDIFHESIGEIGDSASLFLRMLAIPGKDRANFIGNFKDVYLITFYPPGGKIVRVEKDNKLSDLCGGLFNLVSIKGIIHTVIYEVVGIGYHIDNTKYNLIYNNNNVIRGTTFSL